MSLAKHDANKFKPAAAKPKAGDGSLRSWLAKATPVDRETVTVKHGDEERQIEVRSIPSGTRWRLEQDGFDITGQIMPVEFVPTLLIGSCYDPETEEPLFTDDDRDLLAALDKSVTSPLITAAMRLAGFGKREDVDMGKSSEDQAATGSDSASE